MKFVIFAKKHLVQEKQKWLTWKYIPVNEIIFALCAKKHLLKHMYFEHIWKHIQIVQCHRTVHVCHSDLLHRKLDKLRTTQDEDNEADVS